MILSPGIWMIIFYPEQGLLYYKWTLITSMTSIYPAKNEFGTNNSE